VTSSQREGVGDDHLTLRPFVVGPAGFLGGRAHDEPAGRDDHQLGAVRAVAKQRGGRLRRENATAGEAADAGER
jgi:hypothetical protein